MTFDPGRPAGIVKPLWRWWWLSDLVATREVPRRAGPPSPNFRLARAFGGPGADTPKDNR